MQLDFNDPVNREMATQYDEEVRAYCSYGHGVIFGMCFEFVRPNEKLLDIGIGTGLASINFSKVGLKVHGLDTSREMLTACQSKSFAEELKRNDISQGPLPYNDRYFDHVVCCGVFHFLSDLKTMFIEVKRVMKRGGVFAFTIAPQETSSDYIKEPTAWGVPIYKHSLKYIMRLLEENGMDLLKEQRLLMKGANKVDFNMLFSVLIGRSL